MNKKKINRNSNVFDSRDDHGHITKCVSNVLRKIGFGIEYTFDN